MPKTAILCHFIQDDNCKQYNKIGLIYTYIWNASVVRRVDQAKAEQRSRPTYKPRPDHPWRRPFKPEAAGTAAG